MSQDLDKTLAQILLDKKYLSPEQVEFAVKDCRRSGVVNLGQYLIKNKWLDVSIVIKEMQSAQQLIHSKTSYKSTTQGQQSAAQEQSTTAKSQRAYKTTKNSDSATPNNLVIGPGQKFNNYIIIREIARGGMGVVYLAQDSAKRNVALKILLANSQKKEDEARFLREGKAISSLDHPNIVRLYNMDTEQGYRFFTMDYIEGDTLEEVIDNENNLTPLIRIIIKVAKALAAAHEKGIVHRDIKPSNILMNKEKEPFITDFGLAKMTDDKNMTRSGSTLGTPHYMPPEQALGEVKKIDKRSDIYSLGVILYKCLTKQLPFDADTIISLYKKITLDPPILPRKINSKIPVYLENICLKAIEKKQKDRYQSANELARDLEKFLSPRRDRGRGTMRHKRKYSPKIRQYAVAATILLFSIVLYTVLSPKKTIEEPIDTIQNISLQDPPSLKSAIQEAETALREQSYDRVQNIITNFEKLPEVPMEYKSDYYKLRVNFALEKKDYPQAYRYSQLLLQESQDADVYLHCGKSAYFLEKYEEALKLLNESLSFKARTTTISNTYMYLGIIYRTIGEYAKSTSMLQKSIEQDSSNYEAFSHLGAILIDTKKYQEAYEKLVIAKEKNKNDPLVYEGLGRFFLEKGKLVEAISNFEICLKMVPWEAHYYYLYGLALTKQKKYQEAENAFIRSLELEPSNLEAFLPLQINLMDQGSMDKMTLVPGYYNAYTTYSWSHGDPDDLFRDYYNALNLRYRTQQSEIIKPDYERLVQTLKNPKLQEMHQVALNALSYHYQDQRLQNIISQEQNNSDKNIFDTLAVMMQAQKKQDEKNSIRRLVVRLWIGRDPQALSLLDTEKETGILYLQEMLEDSSENIIMRFLSCKTLISLGVPKAYSIVEKYLRKYENIDIAILATIALKEKNFPGNEKIIEGGLQNPDPFLRSFCVRYVKNSNLIIPSLNDKDERVKVYAANRLQNESTVKERCLSILAEATQSENPFIKIYGCISLWPKKIPKENVPNPPQDFVTKYQHTILNCLEDKHPMVKRVAAARIGSHRLSHLSPHLVKLLDDKNEMVRYQAYMSLAWLDKEFDRITEIAKNPNESLLLRSTLIPAIDQKQNMGLPLQIDELIKEEGQQAARFVMSFMGILAGQFGPILLMPYLNHPDENVRVCAISGLIFYGTSIIIPSLEKQIATTTSIKVKSISYASLVGVMCRERRNKIDELHQKILKEPSTVRESASFGYYFQIYQETLNATLRQYIDPKKIQDYDIYRYGNVFNYLYDIFYLEQYKKSIQTPKVQEDYLWRLEKALELAPYGRYYYERALIYQVQKKWNDAIIDLEKAIKLEPNEQKYYDLLIEMHHVSGNNTQLLSVSERLFKLNPRSLIGWKYRGKILYDQEKYNEALDSYQHAFILSPESWLYYEEMAHCSFQLKEYGNALNIFAYLSQNINPENATLVLNTVLCYARLTRYEDAIAFLKERYPYAQLSYQTLSQYPDLNPILSDPWVKRLK